MLGTQTAGGTAVHPGNSPRATKRIHLNFLSLKHGTAKCSHYMNWPYCDQKSSKLEAGQRSLLWVISPDTVPYHLQKFAARITIVTVTVFTWCCCTSKERIRNTSRKSPSISKALQLPQPQISKKIIQISISKNTKWL